MNDLLVGDEELISTTRASEISGYSKDYIGQLCREEKLDCRRVSGLWYVSESGLKTYQESGTQEDTEVAEKEPKKASEYGIKIGNVRDDTFTYDGVEFIATSRAAELTGYAQDYIGQLARGEEIRARKVGRRWFVGKKSLLEHKKHNDGLLAAVQAQASGVGAQDGEVGKENGEVAINIRKDIEPGDINFNVRYTSETDQPLVPKMPTRNPIKEDYAPGDIDKVSVGLVGKSSTTSVPKIRPLNPIPTDDIRLNTRARKDETDETMESEVSKRSNNHEGAFFTPIRPSRSEQQKTSWPGFLLLGLLLLLVFAAIYVYLYGVPEVIANFAATVPFPNLPEMDFPSIDSIFGSLRDAYGDFVPGSNLYYKAQ